MSRLFERHLFKHLDKGNDFGAAAMVSRKKMFHFQFLRFQPACSSVQDSTVYTYPIHFQNPLCADEKGQTPFEILGLKEGTRKRGRNMLIKRLDTKSPYFALQRTQTASCFNSCCS